ncbi:MAG: zinc ABC transporter substrate-binding protein [Firmicutes bacterium]|jgi:ABC-type Zn uptake system ZnuABC Zn-binding protein ZnuA|nr:zinc ABC transporter substrate-binding protein [Bacillota bacterium]
MKRKGLWILFIIGLVWLSSMPALAEVKVVTTFSVLADLAAQVGGDLVVVESIIPPGSDPHHWEPTPREARMIAGADVVFCNGLGLDVWLDRLIANAAAKVPVITLSDGLQALSYQHQSNHDHLHDNGDSDPHMWLDVAYAMDYVKRIAEVYSQIDTANAAYYQSRAESYLQQLRELDNWLLEVVAQIPEDNRKIITYHNSFSYFAQRYGLSVEAYLVLNPDREPSVKDMMQLTQLLAAHPRRVMFIEPQASTGGRYAEAAVYEVGGRIYTLYTDTLTEAVPNYIEMMRWNGNTLLEALK